MERWCVSLTSVRGIRTSTRWKNWAGPKARERHNWRIRVADVDLTRPGQEKQSNVAAITPNGAGFYETHGSPPTGASSISHTDGAHGQVHRQGLRLGSIRHPHRPPAVGRPAGEPPAL